MKPRLLHQDAQHRRTFALAFAKGDEPISWLSRFAREQQLRGSQITGIGAFERAVVGYFDRVTRKYRRIPIEEQAEVLALVGDIAHVDAEPTVHVHVVLGLADGTTRGGHLLEATVWPTLEVVLTEWPAYLCKRLDPDVGLPLLSGSDEALGTEQR